MPKLPTNKAQAYKRGVESSKTAGRNFISSQTPFMNIHLHKHSNTVGLHCDSAMAQKLQENPDLLARLESLLYLIQREGSELSYHDRADNIATAAAIPELRVEGGTDCHLPKLMFKLGEEKKEFVFDVTREALSKAFHAEGYGRGTGLKRYGKADTKPLWWDVELEREIGFSWEKWTGINKFPDYKRPDYTVPWKEVILSILTKLYTHHLGSIEEVDKYIQFRNNLELTKRGKVKAVTAVVEPGNIEFDPILLDQIPDLIFEIENQEQIATPPATSLPAAPTAAAACRTPPLASPPPRPVPAARSPTPPPASPPQAIPAAAAPGRTTPQPPASPSSVPVEPSAAASSPVPSARPVLQFLNNNEDSENENELKFQLHNNLGLIKENVTQADLNGVFRSMTPLPRKRKADHKVVLDLSVGWLKETLLNPQVQEVIPQLQMINWKYRTIGEKEFLTLTLNDGEFVTKEVIIFPDLEQVVRETPLYSVLEITEAVTNPEYRCLAVKKLNFVRTD